MDFRRCLEIQTPYLGPVKGFYTDWTPLTDRPGLFPEDIDTSRSLAVQERAGAVTKRRATTCVMPGLVPGIHHFLRGPD